MTRRKAGTSLVVICCSPPNSPSTVQATGASQAKVTSPAEKPTTAPPPSLDSPRPFTYVAAFGLFTDVSYSTPQANKNLLGHFAYLLEGMGRLASIPS